MSAFSRSLRSVRGACQARPSSRPDDPASTANRAAWEVLKRWDKPFLTAFSDQDPITRGAERVLQRLIPGAAVAPKQELGREARHGSCLITF